jgi:hypothetical protein
MTQWQDDVLAAAREQTGRDLSDSEARQLLRRVSPADDMTVVIATISEITEATVTRLQLESAYRALDYSRVPGNRMPSNDEFALIRADYRAYEPRDDADEQRKTKMIEWIDAQLAERAAAHAIVDAMPEDIVGDVLD